MKTVKFEDSPKLYVPIAAAAKVIGTSLTKMEFWFAQLVPSEVRVDDKGDRYILKEIVQLLAGQPEKREEIARKAPKSMAREVVELRAEVDDLRSQHDELEIAFNELREQYGQLIDTLAEGMREAREPEPSDGRPAAPSVEELQQTFAMRRKSGGAGSASEVDDVPSP